MKIAAIRTIALSCPVDPPYASAAGVQSRPARHTVASGDFTPPMQIQCDLLAVIGN